MSRAVELLCSRRVPHFAVLALMSIGFAGCSADMQTRLSENPFASQPESTASVPSSRVERRELPQYSRPQQVQSQNLPPAISAPQSYPSPGSGVSGGGRGLASYAPPAHPIEATGSVPHSVAAVHARPRDKDHCRHQRHAGDSGPSLQRDASRHPSGQRLQGTTRPFAGTAADHSAFRRGRCGPRHVGGRQQARCRCVAASSVHVVNRGDTLMGIARRNHISAGELARANGLEPGAKLQLGMKLNVPVKGAAAAVPAAQPAVAQAAPASVPPATRAGCGCTRSSAKGPAGANDECRRGARR